MSASSAAPIRPLKGTGISSSTVVTFVLPTLDFEGLAASEQSGLLLQEVQAAMAQFTIRSLRIELGEAEEGVEVRTTIKNASSGEAKALKAEILRAEESFLAEVEQRLAAAQIGPRGVPQRATDLQVMVRHTASFEEGPVDGHATVSTMVPATTMYATGTTALPKLLGRTSAVKAREPAAEVKAREPEAEALLLATSLRTTLAEVRKSGECWWLRADGETQVTIEYLEHADGSVEPKKIHTVVISTQHAEPSKECAGYKGAKMTAPTMDQMNQEIEDKVIKRTLQSITLKNGQPAISLYGAHTHVHVNPSGKFIIGGPKNDAGLTGHKIITDGIQDDAVLCAELLNQASARR